MPAGQRLGVAFELIDAEELRAQRLLVRREPWSAAQASVPVPRRELPDNFANNSFDSRFQANTGCPFNPKIPMLPAMG